MISKILPLLLILLFLSILVKFTWDMFRYPYVQKKKRLAAIQSRLTEIHFALCERYPPPPERQTLFEEMWFLMRERRQLLLGDLTEESLDD